MTTPRAIEHRPASFSFHWTEDDTDSFLEYTLQDSIMTITHTIVPPQVGGRGIAGDLVEAALRTARENQWKVVPSCSYAAAYMRRHAVHQDLLA